MNKPESNKVEFYKQQFNNAVEYLSGATVTIHVIFKQGKINDKCMPASYLARRRMNTGMYIFGIWSLHLNEMMCKT